MLSSTIIPIPTSDKDFEEKCVPLFAGLLNDPNVKTFGARGMKQSGLDLIGKRDRNPTQPVGIQCKLKTKGDKLTEAEVRTEVTKALTLTPALTEYYVVTTASDDPAFDQLAIELCLIEHGKGRTIDIQVWGWETLQQRIRGDLKALNAFDPGHSPATDKLLSLGAENFELGSQIRDQGVVTLERLDVIQAIIASPVDTSRSGAFDTHLDGQVDQYRDLTITGKPRTALRLLEQLEATLTPGNSAAIRARVRANIGIAHLKLGDDMTAGRLLVEAHTINPSDPRVIANRVLGQELLGDVPGAIEFARIAIAADPDNAGIAAFIFQGAVDAQADFDPLELVPAALLEDKNVLLNRINWVRIKLKSDEWHGLAARAWELYSDDLIIERIYGEALLDQTLGSDMNLRASAFDAGMRKTLSAAATHLHNVWQEARAYENASHPAWTMVGTNLATAYRALNQLDAARDTINDVLVIAPADPDALATAAHVAFDRDEPEQAVERLNKLSDSPTKTFMLLNAWSRSENWQAIVDRATPELRALLPDAELEAFDTMLSRALCAMADAPTALGEAEALMASWPDSVGAHVVAADILRRHDREKADAAFARTRSLIGPHTRYTERIMFAQLAGFRDVFDDVIVALDGFVSIDHVSEPLAWLAVAFANSAPRPRTHPFFASLPDEIAALGNFARLAGVAESMRGDLRTAESHFRRALEASPDDLRSHLHLHSVLERDARHGEAVSQILAIDEHAAKGSPSDKMRLAYLLRHQGESARALDLGYRAVMANRGDVDVVTAYPGLFFCREDVPEAVARIGPIASDIWFDLQGEDVPDVKGVVEVPSDGSPMHYAPDHPLALAVMGKSTGDEVVLQPEIGPARRYTVREIKHKYVWLLHDIMATHATQFPASTSMFEMSIKDGDVQPVLDYVREFSDRAKAVTQSYVDLAIPVSAVAAMSHKSVVEFSEHLVQSGIPLHSCQGGTEERLEAIRSIAKGQGQGAVLDTLTVWTAHRLGLLAELKSHFGRLLVPRSTVDELMELRTKEDFNRGRETMTLGYQGEQAVRDVRTPQDTERMIGIFDRAIADIQANCEIMPSNGSDNLLFDDDRVRWIAVAKILDPIYLARDKGVILLSEDLRLRQLAHHVGVTEGAWLQTAFRVMTDAGDNALTEAQYLAAIGQLAALHHDHIWLDVSTLLGLLTLDDPRAETLFDCAAEYIGCHNAEIRSHIAVTFEFMCRAWGTSMPNWKQGRAIGKLLTMLIRFRQDDWRDILLVIDRELGARTGRQHGAREAQEYIRGWVQGHFLNIDYSSQAQMPVRRKSSKQARRAK